MRVDRPSGSCAVLEFDVIFWLINEYKMKANPMKNIAKLLIALCATGYINSVSANDCHDYNSRVMMGRDYELNLSDCNIDDNDIDEVIEYLNTHGKIYYVALDNNKLHAEGAKKLAKTRYLGGIGLANNYLGDDGARTIVKNIRIQDISLEGNQITDAAVKELAKQPQLRRLNLSNNMITDIGAKLLANSNVTNDLYLARNQISDDGAIALANAQSKNRNFTNLDLSSNLIGPAGKTALSIACQASDDCRYEV